ncbi:Rha family transcriptional regulator, partial [Enterobacter hormaechei]|nr:Rha family transcriptional regulator [Enterobacter hormaechei]
MNNPSVIPAFDFREMVTTLDNKIITTSLKVADYFGKRHKDV